MRSGRETREKARAGAAVYRVSKRQRKELRPRRAAPVGALCERSPRIRPSKVVAPTGAARRRLGSLSRFKTPLQFRLPPRRGASAIFVPQSGRIGRCTPASAPFGSPSARGYPRRGALGLASPFTTRKKRDFHFPRPMGLARVVPKETFDWRCPIGRGSPFKVVVKPLFLCFAPLADFARGRGATRAVYTAQNRARHFPAKQACRKTAALGFPPSAGVAPLSIERDDTTHD